MAAVTDMAVTVVAMVTGTVISAAGMLDTMANSLFPVRIRAAIFAATAPLRSATPRSGRAISAML